MNSTTNVTLKEYRQIWARSVRQVLSKLTSVAFEARSLGPGALPPKPPDVYALFAVGAPMAGEQSVTISTPEALALCRLMQPDLPAEGAALEAVHREVVAELFRQVASAVSTALAARLGRECEVRLARMEPPSWTPVPQATFGIQASAPQALEAILYCHADPQLALVLGPAPAQPERAPATPANSNGSPNLAFLKDVQLAVTLRFGRCQVSVRDILHMLPDSVVELEQDVEEPVELLIGKRVIAWGDVVVVDGNYGLRVTKVVGEPLPA